MLNTNVITTSRPLTLSKQFNPPMNVDTNPAKVLEFAHLAAKALKQVIDSKPKKTIIKGEEYLNFEDWQTIARFYNVTVGTDWTKPITNNGKSFGYEAKAVAYKDGTVISSAEASCYRDEPNWTDKPTFQIKSMCQTRAAAKCLRNVFAWVVILAGYKPTPAEEMCEVGDSAITPTYTDVIPEKLISNNRGWEERNDSITDKQTTLLRNLILEKITDENLRESELITLSDLSKPEASARIQELINTIC